MRKIGLFLLFIILVFSVVTYADEGMWLLNNVPKKYLEEKYGFAVTEKWLEHIQKAAVRFPYGSGAFISSAGLVLTNHHVASETLYKLSTKERNYYETGFLAKTRDQEVKSHDLELDVLMSIEDITDKVNSVVKPDMTPEQAYLARQAAIIEIEKESKEKTGLESEVVTLYQGGAYHLYRYKRYTDVRLVFAPEKAIAFFGGDPDNFEYPRYDLDFAIFRVYENGKPAEIKYFFPLSEMGACENELVFVVGNPGRTNRLDTVAKLKFWRDNAFPFLSNFLRRLEILYQQFGYEGIEQKRIAENELFSIQNSRKAYDGMLKGLQDPALMEKKESAERDLRARVNNDAWDNIAQIQNFETYKRFKLIEQCWAFESELFSIARIIVRLVEEIEKPNSERLPEYGEANIESLKFQLFSEAPIYKEFERVRLTDSLSFLAETFGCDDPFVKKVLDGRNLQELVNELISGTKLEDIEYRKKLIDDGLKAVQTSNDPMIQFVLLVDSDAREARKEFEKIQEVEKQAYAKISKAIFELMGTEIYPDATFTLRLTFGLSKGYTENGKEISYQTTIGGAFKHAANHKNKEPWQLPESWLKKKNKLNLNTSFNFVSTTDVVGGNSGSPVLNQRGELVGLVFDGNIQSLVYDFVYTEEQARTVAVSSCAILEALRKIYKAKFLADEIGK